MCYVHVLKTNRTKPDPRARHCIFFGYDTHGKGWRYMDPETKKVIIYRDVVFDEVSSHEIYVNMNSNTVQLSPFFGDNASNTRGNITTPSGENIKQKDITRIFTRTSSRQRMQPDYLTDYKVYLNLLLCCVLFMGDS